MTIIGAVETTVGGWRQYFAILQDAVNYCPPCIDEEWGHVKFKLMEDLEINQTIEMGYNNYWPLDLNGHQITGSGTLFENDSQYGFLIENTSDQPAAVTISSADVPAILNSGVLSLKNVTLLGGSCGVSMKKTESWDPSLTLDGGTFEDAANASTVFTMPGSAVTVTANFVHISYNDPDTYTLRSSVGAGGRISPSGNTTVEEGDDQTFAVKANAGYEIEDVLVDGKSVGVVSSYTFKKVKKAHTIKASFAEKKTANPFGDVGKDDWYYDNVMYVYQNGLMNGTAPDTFSPNGGMTWGMFVTVLYRLSGDTGSYTSDFTDVPSGKWCEKAVAWAAQNGISGGVGNNRFAPDADSLPRCCTATRSIRELTSQFGKT